nr:hypothetical protein [Tanacetum cinerariifolium]
SAKKTSYKEAAKRVLHFSIKEPGWMEGKALKGNDTGGDKRKFCSSVEAEQESAKKLKTSEEVHEEVKSPDEVPQEK